MNVAITSTAMNRAIQGLFALALSLALMTASGCSRLKGYFPDKEKEYQYSAEIAPLDIPPDLSSSTIEDPAIQSAATAATARLTPAPPIKSDEEKAAEEPKAKESPLLKMGAASLEIAQPFAQAWRLVDKGLGRKAIEVPDRDRSRGVFFVIYEEYKADAPKEGSLWAEFLYIFGKEPRKETEFRVVLEEKESGVTEVTLHDKEGKRMTQGGALQLLQLLREGMEAEP